jgi:hypothetical protein
MCLAQYADTVQCPFLAALALTAGPIVVPPYVAGQQTGGRMVRRASGTGKAEQPHAALIRVIFDPESRKFGFFAPEFERACTEFKYATAHEATSEAFCYAETAWCDGGKLADASIDLTIEGGDFDDALPNVRRVDTGDYRLWLNAHLYSFDEDELRRDIAQGVEQATAAQRELAARWEVPLGQSMEAARLLYKRRYPHRRRGSNDPTLNQYLDELFPVDQTTRDRWYKAYMIVAASDWPAMLAGYAGKRKGIAGILDAARQFARKPTRPKRTPIRDRYAELRNALDADDLQAARAAAKRHDDEDTER